MDALAMQMNSMMKLLETFNRWRPNIDSFTTGLSKDLKELKSRVEALEAHPKPALPLASKREEEGQVIVDHGIAPPPQESDARVVVLPGQWSIHSFHFPCSQCPMKLFHTILATTRKNFVYLRLIFPNLMARILGFGRKKLRSILTRLMCLFIVGPLLPPFILKALLSYGCKHMKLSIELIVG